MNALLLPSIVCIAFRGCWYQKSNYAVIISSNAEKSRLPMEAHGKRQSMLLLAK
jgi:hypothetical protein